MRRIFRLACLMLVLCVGATAAHAQNGAPPQRPFSQLVGIWTRQLDRIAVRADQSDMSPAEIDSLREQALDVRTAAAAAAALARSDLADTKKLLAPLEPKTGADKSAAEQTPDSDAVKAERDRLTEQASISESRVKQCEVIIARADQLLDRMTKLRGQVVLETLLRRGLSPLSPNVWQRVGPEFAAATQSLSKATAAWASGGLFSLSSGGEDLTPLVWWALLTIGLWWLGRTARNRFGRGEHAEPGQRDRTIAAAIDGVGVVLVPMLAVWLIGKLLAASHPPPPIDRLLPDLIQRLISFLLVVGLTATTLAPHRPAWRVMPFTDASAQTLSTALRRLMAVGIVVDLIFLALTQGQDREALTAIGALVLATTVALLTLPALADRAWQAVRTDGSDQPAMVGGVRWSVARLVLSIAILSSIVFALLGYATLAAHIHAAIAITCLLLALALLFHRFCGDALDAAAAPETPTGRWVRRRLGLAPDTVLHGQNIVLLLIDFALVAMLGAAIPAAWGVDIDAIQTGFGQLLSGVRIGGVTISLGNIGLAILAFGITMLLARLVRSVMRDRVMPTVDAPLPLRQSIDAALNYAGVIIAILIGVGALGIDFTNLAIVLGALSVGIGLGLQNIANNVISGVIMLMERPVKAGDWISVNGFEGFVRRINIRATEIETFQRTHVIVPNSLFLQNPVINRTYADTSSRIDISLTVGLGTDVTKMETLLRETALAHPRVLRVPAPIVRFVRVTPAGLEFELFVFVMQLADRTVVNNDLNRDILARLIEEKIIDPAGVPELRLRDLDKLAALLSGRASGAGTEERSADAAPPPPR
ncbi:MAG: mechanosensitive ion channel family protein [Proteobacteria bacterium]|nr:mechanosensitive ion channel family protein [Pseudomonadota bacterium]